MGRLIVDTDIIIDALRGHDKALQFLEEYEAIISLSAMTLMELYAGVRDKEKEKTAQVCGLYEVIDVTASIATRAGEFRQRYGKSHASGFVDCILAATAVETGAMMMTLNKKHYPMLERVESPYAKP